MEVGQCGMRRKRLTMANPKHVEIVRKGVVALEKWRRNSKDEILNLVGADLTNECQLSRANLAGAYFSHANLFLADLSYANLAGAHLFDANLSGADLSNADLSKADLSYAHLRLVNLTQANLSESDLSGASLCLPRSASGTINLKGAFMKDTSLVECDMNEFEGPETVKHKGPKLL